MRVVLSPAHLCKIPYKLFVGAASFFPTKNEKEEVEVGASLFHLREHRFSSLSPFEGLLFPLFHLRDGRARRCSRAGVRASRSCGLLRFLQGPENISRRSMASFFWRSLDEPSRDVTSLFRLVLLSPSPSPSFSFSFLLLLLSHRRFLFLPSLLPEKIDLGPARLHPLWPLLQVLRRQLRRRHRSADGGLLDREFFFLLSFSLVTSFPFLSLPLFPAFFPCVFKSLHLSPPLLFHSPRLLFLSPPLPSLSLSLSPSLTLSLPPKRK